MFLNCLASYFQKLYIGEHLYFIKKMVALIKRVGYLVVFILVFTLFASIISAQGGDGCCCQNTDPYFQDGLIATQCTGTFYAYNETFDDPALCPSQCVVECSYPSCEANNSVVGASVCFCGTTVIDSNNFCCAGSNTGYETSAGCSADNICNAVVDIYNVFGYVYDQNGNPIEGAVIHILNIPGETNVDGYYELFSVTEGTIEIIAQKMGCAENSSSYVLSSNLNNANVYLDCSYGGQECSAIGGICCGETQECADAGISPVGTSTCNNCYVGCSSCQNITLPATCSYGQCDIVNNNWCDATNNWVHYDLSVANERDVYCEDNGCLAQGDPECTTVSCLPGICDGVCNSGCTSPEEDPDCGAGLCDVNNDRWCSQTLGDWVYEATDSSSYCAQCGSDDTATCGFFCGNGVVEGTEQCDYDDSTGTYDALPGVSCENNFNDCSWGSCTCIQPPTCNLNGQLEPGEDCDGSSYSNTCINFDHCTASCECVAGNACLEVVQNPAISGIGLVGEDAAISLSWTLESVCDSYVDSFVVLRCDGEFDAGECAGSWSPTDINSGIYSYSDSDNIQPNSWYSYIVRALYPGNIFEDSNPVKIQTGDAACMESHEDTFCYNNPNSGIYYCDSNNLLQIFVDSGQDQYCLSFCYEDDNGPECKGITDCQECNSVYGEFSAYGKNNLYVEYEPHGDFLCDNLATIQNVCYLDYTLTAVDKYYDCSEVTSCYDYSSKTSCDYDPCGQFASGECSWNNYQEEFGLGICTSNVLEEQDCSRCSDGSNNLFPYCNKELCSLYGAACYFDGLSNNKGSWVSGCKNELDLECRDYDNVADCIGLEEYNVDITYNGNQRTGITHFISNYSDDYFDFGKCKWDTASDELCYRDSNDDSDVFDISYLDCTVGDLKCRKDFQAPVTSVFVQDAYGALFSAEYNVVDNVYNIDNGDFETYYCVTEQPNTCYPNANTDLASGNVFTYTPSTSGNYILYYYSIDPAKNIEVLQNKTFTVDKTGPTITIDWNYVPYFNGEWKSELFINVSLDENATCQFNLTDSNNNPEGSQHEVGGTNFSFYYQGLEDGRYLFNYNCVDKFGNAQTISGPKVMLIEGDISISNPLPEGTLNYRNVKLNITTQNFAECRYSTVSPLYSDMNETLADDVNRIYEGTFTTNATGKLHKHSLTLPGSGAYRFYTACNVSKTEEDGSTSYEITENNNADWILFAIDQISPTTIVRDTTAGLMGSFKFSQWHPELHLTFECVDIPMIDYGKNWAYGCNEPNNYESVYLCENPNEFTSCNPNASWSGSTFEKITSGEYTIRFYSEDNGGNDQVIREETLHIDNDLPVLTFTVKDFFGNEVSTLGYGWYNIHVESSKLIQSVDRFNYTLEGVDYSIGYTPSDYSINSNLNITNIDRFRRKPSIPLTFHARVTDYHGVNSGDQSTSGIILDTAAPTHPTLDPLFTTTSEVQFEDWAGNDYPLYYYNNAIYGNGLSRNNTYYTNDPNLFVTGQTSSQFIGMIEFYLVQKIPMDYNEPAEIYDQLSETNIGSDTHLGGNQNILVVYQGPFSGSSITVQEDLSLDNYWVAGNYLEVLSHNRKSYGNYKKFYLIESVNSGALTSVINLAETLETTVNTGDSIKVYDKDHLNIWFGKELNLTYDIDEADENAYLFHVAMRDDLDNVGMSTGKNLFFDNEKPKIESGLITGTIVNEYQTISVNISELKSGSGINVDDWVLEITGPNGVVPTSSALFVYSSEDSLRYYYTLSFTPPQGSPWVNGNYSIVLNLQDYAGNVLDDNGYNTKACKPGLDGCCAWEEEDDTCDPDCRLTNGVYDLGEDPDCTDLGGCTANSDDCCLYLPEDGLCDLQDCYADTSWDVDCNCVHNECNPFSQLICQYGEWLPYEDINIEGDYCAPELCGLEDPICSDCEAGTAPEDFCDYENQRWCRNNGADVFNWTTEDYNIMCGALDSTCLDNYVACNPYSCDSEEHFICNEDGFWVDKVSATNYANECGRVDSSVYPSPDAQTNDCDISNNDYYDGSGWNFGSSYCTVCKLSDSECYDSNFGCIEGFCDTAEEYYCSGDVWDNSAYESTCGSKDYDYGCSICIPDTCDVLNQEYCNDNNQWIGIEEGYCDYDKCYIYDNECITSVCLNTKDDCCVGTSDDNVCDPDCTATADTNCEICTNEEGDCCVAADDEQCDPDCPAGMDNECADDWVFTLDKEAPNTPIINVIGANENNPHHNNKWNVQNTPSLTLDYTQNVNGSEEQLDIQIKSAILNPATTNINCVVTTKNFFSCTFTEALSEGIYDVELVAQKLLQNGSLGSEKEDLFVLIIDNTNPEFNLTISPEYSPSDQPIQVEVYVTNEGSHELMMSMEVEGTTLDNLDSYNNIFQIPASFAWNSEGEKTITFTVVDYAGNSRAETATIYIDDSEPELNDINVYAENILLNRLPAFTVGTENISIVGTTSTDTVEICYISYCDLTAEPRIDCIYPCDPATIQCIEPNGDFEIFPPPKMLCGGVDSETFKDVILIATDNAGNTFNSTVEIWLDLKSPDEPEISIE